MGKKPAHYARFMPVRLAMVGGGEGAFIGNIHRLAANLDGQYQLVAGAFSRDKDNCKRTGVKLGLAENRCYTSWQELLNNEARLDPDSRAECIAIVTPNHLHFAVSEAALKAGFHVLCDKPATRTLKEAQQLQNAVKSTSCLFGLTHTYLGYPMIAQARRMVAEGDIGNIRKIYVEYPQGWMAGAAEKTGSKQAEWRTDPARSGIGGAIGDIGTHAFTLAEWVSGQQVTALCAALNIHIDDRLVDDDAAAHLKFDGGATGVLVCSQVCAGEENALKIKIYGDKGALEWHQMEPNSLIHRRVGDHMITLRAGVDQPLYSTALARCRTPSGHPEGYLEAFANLYRDFAHAIRAGEQQTARLVPGIDMGLRGMMFIERMVDSHKSTSKWTDFETGEHA